MDAVNVIVFLGNGVLKAVPSSFSIIADSEDEMTPYKQLVKFTQIYSNSLSG